MKTSNAPTLAAWIPLSLLVIGLSFFWYIDRGTLKIQNQQLQSYINVLETANTKLQRSHDSLINADTRLKDANAELKEADAGLKVVLSHALSTAQRAAGLYTTCSSNTFPEGKR